MGWRREGGEDGLGGRGEGMEGGEIEVGFSGSRKTMEGKQLGHKVIIRFVACVRLGAK